MLEYKLRSDRDHIKIMEKINEDLAEGWKLRGLLQIKQYIWEGPKWHYFQELVRERENKNIETPRRQIDVDSSL